MTVSFRKPWVKTRPDEWYEKMLQRKIARYGISEEELKALSDEDLLGERIFIGAKTLAYFRRTRRG